MPTRIFTPDQLAAIGVPNPYDAEAEQRAEHLFDEQIDTRRWVSMHHLVFRGPDDGKAWRVEYVRGLTESQDGISPWEYAGATVEAVEVEQVATTVMEWHAIPDAPAVPSDAELIEHARTLGMVEPERAPSSSPHSGPRSRSGRPPPVRSRCRCSTGSPPRRPRRTSP